MSGWEEEGGRDQYIVSNINPACSGCPPLHIQPPPHFARRCKTFPLLFSISTLLPILAISLSLSVGWCSLVPRPSRSPVGARSSGWSSQVIPGPALISATASQCPSNPFQPLIYLPALLFACQQQRHRTHPEQ